MTTQPPPSGLVKIFILKPLLLGKPHLASKDKMSSLFFQPDTEKDGAARKKVLRPFSAAQPRPVGIERKKDRL
jgi:hypothetical protein